MISTEAPMPNSTGVDVRFESGVSQLNGFSIGLRNAASSSEIPLSNIRNVFDIYGIIKCIKKP